MINNFEDYLITDQGNIFSLKYNKRKRLSLIEDAQGYLRVNLSICGKIIKRLVRQLVLETFVGERPEGMEACHLNDIKTGNRLKNLYWGTKGQNANDCVRNGNHATKRKFGEDHNRSKNIKQFDQNFNLINIFGSICEASRLTKICRSSISDCANGRIKSSGGFIWRLQ